MRYQSTVLAVFLVAGCSSQSATSPEPTPSPKASGSTNGARHLELTMHIWTDAPDGNSQVQKFDNVTQESIEKQFRAVDWTNARVNPSITLQHDNSNSLSITGTLNAVNIEEKLVAEWSMVPAGQTVVRHRRSVPLGSADTALAILLSYFNEDGRLGTLVTWHDN